MIHTDHLAYLGTVERMHAGESFYSAYLHSYVQDAGIRMGRPRGFREPAIFLVWRLLPTSALFIAFLAMIVLTTYLLAKISVRPAAAIVPGVFLILASRTTITEWLLVEFWTLPFLVGSLVAWKRERWWTAAALAATAIALRETAAPLLLACLVVALLRRKPWQPWAVCGTVALVAFSINDFIASRYVLDHGNDAVLAGTGRPFGTVVQMMAWPFQNEAALALCLIGLWMAAIWYVARRDEWLPVVGLLAIPLLGFVVNRGYWGLLATPFAIWLAADGILETLAARRSRPAGIVIHPTSDEPRLARLRSTGCFRNRSNGRMTGAQVLVYPPPSESRGC